VQIFPEERPVRKAQEQPPSGRLIGPGARCVAAEQQTKRSRRNQNKAVRKDHTAQASYWSPVLLKNSSARDTARKEKPNKKHACRR